MPRKTSEYRFTTESLRSFLAVAEHGSFHKAADRIGLSQPAVSQHILGLERKLGAALFTRAPVQLTDAGEKFLTHAQRIEDELAAAGLIANGSQISVRPKPRYDPNDPDNLLVHVEHPDDVADGFRKAVEYDRTMAQIKGRRCTR